MTDILTLVENELDAPDEPPPAKVFVVAVYLADRAYGGPEEGGWWFDCGERVRVMRVFKNADLAYDYCSGLNDRLQRTLNKGRRPIQSVLSDGVYRAMVWPESAPRLFPEHRPHYE